jgi:hypothetical protein
MSVERGSPPVNLWLPVLKRFRKAARQMIAVANHSTLNVHLAECGSPIGRGAPSIPRQRNCR